MNRAALCTMAVMLPLLTTPLAAAQAPSTATPTKTQVVAQAFDERLPEGTEATTPVEVTYCHQPGVFSTEPTNVEVAVNGTPAWASASVDPSTLEFPMGPQTAGAEECRSRTTNLTVTVASSAPDATHGEVELVAEAQPNGPHIQGSTGRTQVPVSTAGSPAADGNGTDVNTTSSANAQDAGDAGSNGVPAPHAPLVALAMVAAAGVVQRRYGGGEGHT